MDLRIMFFVIGVSLFFFSLTTIHNANSTEIPERKSKVNGGVLVEKYAE